MLVTRIIENSLMKYILGIDYGTKYTGIARAGALSAVRIAVPWQVVPTDELHEFVNEHKEEIDSVVLGRSVDLKGKENTVQNNINAFRDFLQEQNIKIAFIDERFTSQASLAENRLLARKTKTRKKTKKHRLDAKAATIILQNFLDGGGMS